MSEHLMHRVADIFILLIIQKVRNSLNTLDAMVSHGITGMKIFRRKLVPNYHTTC